MSRDLDVRLSQAFNDALIRETGNTPGEEGDLDAEALLIACGTIIESYIGQVAEPNKSILLRRFWAKVQERLNVRPLQ